MPISAFGLVALFIACSIVLGWLAVRLLARFGGPTGRAAYVLPIAAGFLAFYLIGHKLGIAVGPEIPLLGFQVALIGDLAIGFAAALVVAAGQWLVVRAVAARRADRGVLGAGPRPVEAESTPPRPTPAKVGPAPGLRPASRQSSQPEMQHLLPHRA